MVSTYAGAGVDIKHEEIAIKGIIDVVKKTFKNRAGKSGEVIADIGAFANVIDIGGGKALAMCTDGAGSKVLIAQYFKKYDTIGIDMVAMNVNDLLCIGAEPIALVDYLAVEKVKHTVLKDISKGIYVGANMANIAVIGGETATLPEVIKGLNEGEGFDIAGTAIGLVDKDKIITGENIKAGDVVIGFKSSGIHSNGMTLARKVLPKAFWSYLLVPTRIYVREILEILNKFNSDITGLAHITGGGFRNLSRLSASGFTIDNLPQTPMIFSKIQKMGEVPDEEMYKTFNMGIGFCAVVKACAAAKIVEEYGSAFKCSIIGKVTEDRGVKIIKNKKEILL